MLDPVLQELVKRQHDIARFGDGDRWAVSDEELASLMMDYYDICPCCDKPLDFKPRVAVAFCESADHFIYLYGMALNAHHKDSPQCDGKLKELADFHDPKVRKKIKDDMSKFTEEDYRRWEGKK